MTTGCVDPYAVFALLELHRATASGAYLELAAAVCGNIAARSLRHGLFTGGEGSRYAKLDSVAPLALLHLAAELRVEKPGREREITRFDPHRYAELLPLAWASAGVAFEASGEVLAAKLPEAERRRLRRAWARRARFGKPLNAARLVKAASTFDGAARYAAWKIARHTGVEIPVTPWRERHPVLAAPGVAWRIWRARR